MSSIAYTVLGTAVLALLLAGYLAQHYLPPPVPKIVGFDLGTTYSCVAIYHAVTGNVDVLKDAEGHKCIPSTVAFAHSDVFVGYKALAQADHNPENTIYDAKRFIGKKFTLAELDLERNRYPFQMKLDTHGNVSYVVGSPGNKTSKSSEEIGAYILKYLRSVAQSNLTSSVTRAVLSVPAEFTQEQRNATRRAAELAGMEVYRIINEPTAAALAYGMHKKEGIHFVMVVDLGGGTLDVSLLNIQGGMFLTQAMAGNNHLGGQDFNQRLMTFLQKKISFEYKQVLKDPEDLQALRMATEKIKIDLSITNWTLLTLPLHSVKTNINSQGPVIFKYNITRQEFEDLNEDLLLKVLEPIRKVLEHIELTKDWVDEIVLVGGSTRIPKVRQLIRDFFDKEPNTSIDPELAVASGVAIQAGILGGMWPLTVSATELPTNVKKIHV